MAAKFEVVSKYKDADIKLPVRRTAESAGYDLFVAEDTLIPPYDYLKDEIFFALDNPREDSDDPVTLKELAALVKKADAKITLVSTGVKCKLDPGTYLQLSVRSSFPLKHWLVLGNSVGIIDGDYYGNESNEGEIFLQIINLSPVPVILKKGDAIGQGIIMPYLKTEDDCATAVRTGGFGSTDHV